MLDRFCHVAMSRDRETATVKLAAPPEELECRRVPLARIGS